MGEEAPKSRGWGGRRPNLGRKKRKLVPDDDINTDPIGGGGQPSTSRPISMSKTGQSVSHQRPNIIRRAATTVASSIRNTVSGFFGTRTSQQAQAVGHTNQINTTNNPVEPLSASASVGDEDGDEDDSMSAEMAQKETTDAEVTVIESANHQWLKATLDQIINDPPAIGRGNSGFANTSLGYNENPTARRVSTLTGQDYFLLTNRFWCPSRREDGKGCGQSYQGSDPWIIRQLPEFVQRAFRGIFNLTYEAQLSPLFIGGYIYDIPH
ncbi:hypothetical protein K438DRAFT_1776893 [Mycena galopus ATCC 62051]|nr:hypothetical protein K438DRAFT_1776893 [Mycena galopus ATCC 62051]